MRCVIIIHLIWAHSLLLLLSSPSLHALSSSSLHAVVRGTRLLIQCRRISENWAQGRVWWPVLSSKTNDMCSIIQALVKNWYISCWTALILSEGMYLDWWGDWKRSVSISVVAACTQRHRHPRLPLPRSAPSFLHVTSQSSHTWCLMCAVICHMSCGHAVCWLCTRTNPRADWAV